MNNGATLARHGALNPHSISSAVEQAGKNSAASSTRAPWRMAPKCQVAKLKELALYHVVRQVTYALSDDESLYYDDVRDYYKFTPPEVLEDILKEILRNTSLDAGTRYSCLETLLKNNVKFLETGMFPQYYYESILEVIAMRGSGLQHLNLKGVWVKDSLETLCLALNQMNQLRVLHVPHVANDLLLSYVANIRTLRVLNVCGDCQFSKEGLEEFCATLKKNKSRIRVLDIGSFGEENIPHEIVGDLIEALPELTTLVSYSFVGKSLLYLYKKNKHFTCNLKYVHDINTTKEICEATMKTCPMLETLFIGRPDNKVLEMISGFKTVTCLRLVKFQCHELHLLLEKWGQNLQRLKVALGRGILDVSKLAACCPELVGLEMYKMEFVSHTADTPLRALEDLEILYGTVTGPCLRYVLREARCLKKLWVDGGSEGSIITDGDIYRLCADGYLLHLEQLWFSSARYLTMNTIELLSNHCPQLRLIGSLSGWNLHQDEIDLMRAILQSTNSDLTLLPLEPSFEQIFD